MEKSKRDFLKTVSIATATSYGLMKFGAFGSLANAAIKTKKRKPSSTDEWAYVREQFSLTHNRVYFNNGTIGPSPSPVLSAVIDAMKQVELTGEHHEADGSTLREKLATFVGASTEEISLTHNTSESINIVAQGLPLKSGDEVIITTHEHVGNALPWLNRARLDGIVLKSFEPENNAAAVLSKIESMVTEKTKVIAIPFISCTTGQVFPIEAIVKMAHAKKIWVFVDGAHATGMLPLHLHDLGIDFFASCGHKWLCGPKGTGYLYIKKELLNTVEAKFVGAYSDTGWTLNPPKMNGLTPSAHRYDYGSQNTALYAGFSAAIDFFNHIGMQKISDYGCSLSQTLQDELLKHPAEIEVLTPTETKSRGMMLSFRFKSPSKDYVKFAAFAGKNGFRVRQVPEAGLNAIRVSTHLYNSKEEVLNFVKVVEQFLLIS